MTAKAIFSFAALIAIRRLERRPGCLLVGHRYCAGGTLLSKSGTSALCQKHRVGAFAAIAAHGAAARRNSKQVIWITAPDFVGVDHPAMKWQPIGTAPFGRDLGFAVLFAFLFVIWSAIPFAAVRAENSSPAKFDTPDNGRAEQDVRSSVKISSETARSYINWIIQQTGWPAAGIPPIKTTSFAHLRKLSGLSSDAEWIRPAAFYSKSEHLIYLADSWNEDDLVDQSILVHELVHHLQIEHHIKFACWGRYEAQAYELQVQWLRTRGVKDPHNLLHASKASIESLAECP
jgi:hypothetical protein